MDLAPETLQKIESLFPKYPDKRSLTLPLCHLIQEDQGYLSDEAMKWIAAKLDLEPMKVLEVVSFYPMFRRKPIGKVHVKVCRTLSCALNGAYKTCEKLEEALNCARGGTSEDGNYTIEFVECIADCGKGPRGSGRRSPLRELHARPTGGPDRPDQGSRLCRSRSRQPRRSRAGHAGLQGLINL